MIFSSGSEIAVAEKKHNVLDIMTKRIQFHIMDYSRSKALLMADSELARRYSHTVSLIKRHIVDKHSAGGVGEGEASRMIDVNNGEFIKSNRYFYITPERDAELDKLFQELKKVNSASKSVHEDSISCDVDIMDSLIRAYEIFSSKNPNSKEVLETKDGIKKIKEYREKFYKTTQVERDEIGRNLRSYLLSEIKRFVVNFYNNCVKYETVPLCYKAFNDAVKAAEQDPKEFADYVLHLTPPFVNTSAEYSSEYIDSLIEKYHIAAFGKSPFEKRAEPTVKKSAPKASANKGVEKTAISSKATKKETKKQKPAANKSSERAPEPVQSSPFLKQLESDFRFTGASLRKYVGKSERLLLPDGITKIWDGAFDKAKTFLREIVIPDGISEIVNNLFGDCEKLEKVVLPSTIVYINYHAFGNCPKLKDINFPDSVRYISIDAFKNCTALKRVSIPENCDYSSAFPPECVVTVRADRASKPTQSVSVSENEKKPITTDESQFKIENKICKKYLGKDESVIIPAGIKKIGSSAFSKNKHIKNVVIPEGVTEIASLAFYNCENLVSVTLPTTLKTIKNEVFEGCVKLRDIKLPDSITKMEGLAFLRCESLTEISIPRGLETVEIRCFASCKSLNTVIFSENVKKISSLAFDDCVKLKSVTLPRGCKHSDYLPSFPEGCKIKLK